MARWMDKAGRFGILPFAIFLVIALTFPVSVYGQTENSPPSEEGGREVIPTEFESLGGEGVLGGDVPTRDDFLTTRNENLPSIGLFNIALSLGLVLLVFWVIFRFVVRPLMRGAVLGRGIEDFRIVATLPIAATKSIQIVKVVDRLLVVGLAEGGMHLLTEITDAEEASEILKALDEKHPSKYHPFKKAFETMLSRKEESVFEDRQKTFNTSLGRLKEKIEALRGSSGEEDYRD